jgi:hypothetical protein
MLTMRLDEWPEQLVEEKIIRLPYNLRMLWFQKPQIYTRAMRLQCMFLAIQLLM